MEERIHLDKVTFIALLSACSHAGLIERRVSFYNSMREVYGVVPDMVHCSCMVNLSRQSWELRRCMGFCQEDAR